MSYFYSRPLPEWRKGEWDDTPRHPPVIPPNCIFAPPMRSPPPSSVASSSDCACYTLSTHATLTYRRTDGTNVRYDPLTPEDSISYASCRSSNASRASSRSSHRSSSTARPSSRSSHQSSTTVRAPSESSTGHTSSALRSSSESTRHSARSSHRESSETDHRSSSSARRDRRSDASQSSSGTYKSSTDSGYQSSQGSYKGGSEATHRSSRNGHRDSSEASRHSSSKTHRTSSDATHRSSSSTHRGSSEASHHTSNTSRTSSRGSKSRKEHKSSHVRGLAPVQEVQELPDTYYPGGNPSDPSQTNVRQWADEDGTLITSVDNGKGVRFTRGDPITTARSYSSPQPANNTFPLAGGFVDPSTRLPMVPAHTGQAPVGYPTTTTATHTTMYGKVQKTTFSRISTNSDGQVVQHTEGTKWKYN